jgi:hypothetical protein
MIFRPTLHEVPEDLEVLESKLDSTIKWKISDDVDSLVQAILDCKKELTKACFSMNGSAKIIDFDVLASSKICEFLMTSELSKSPNSSESIEKKEWQKYISNFELFRLHKYKHIDNETIRILASFDVGDSSHKMYFGNVVFDTGEAEETNADTTQQQ